MMTVRMPTEMEVERAAEVAAEAFGANTGLEHTREVFGRTAELFGREFILVVELDGKLVSSLICTPGPVFVGGGAVTHSAVGFVGTLADYRKRGCAGIMMAECAKLLRRQGLNTSSLWPFSYEYYRRYGWELGSEVRRCVAPSKTMAGIAGGGSVRWAGQDDAEAIKRVYDSQARAYNAMTQRSQMWWDRIVKLPDLLRQPDGPGHGCAVHVTGGVVDGYAVCEISRQDEGSRIEIKEVFSQNPVHRRELLALVATADLEAALCLDAPLDDTLIHELSDPRSVNISILPSFQFRVIDPPAAMEALHCDQTVSGKLSFELADPVFEGGFRFGVEIDGGRISLCPFDAASAITTHVQTFAKLYSGYLSPSTALRLNCVSIQGDADAVLGLSDRVLATRTPYRSWLEPG